MSVEPPGGARTSAQFIRFLVVGALNTAFGYAVFAALILAGVAPAPALIATYLVGVPFNYFTTGRLVFSGSKSAFFKFVAAYVVIYLFNAALFTLLEWAGAHPLVAQAVCLPIVAVFSFFLFKLHVFKRP